MEGLLGLVLTLLGWAAFGLQAASSAKRKRLEAARGAQPPPVPAEAAVTTPLSAEELFAAARRRLQRASDLAPSSRSAALSEEIRSTLEAARGLEAAAGSERSPSAEMRLEGAAVLARARVLEALAHQHASPVDGPLVRLAERAIESALPEIAGRVVVARHSDGSRGDAELSGSELIVLSLSPEAGHRPWLFAELVEEAWTEVLTSDPAAEDAIRQGAAAGSKTDSAMDRFAAALVVAWAPALVVDAACTLSLGAGHVAWLHRRLRETPSEAAMVVRIDAHRRVDARPPIGLRLRLVDELRATLGPGDATIPPSPPGSVLHLRGPGVWDQVALEPVRGAASRTLQALAAELAGRPGLHDTRETEERARDLLQAMPDGRASETDGRTRLTALALSAESAESLSAARRLLAAWAEAEATPQRPTRGARPRAARHHAEPAEAPAHSRARAVQQALLLGAAFGEPPH